MPLSSKTMKKLTAINLILILCFLAGCVPQTQPAYYVSPLDVNSNYYRAIPLRSDSVRTALYASAALTAGGSNDRWRDNLHSFHGSFHVSHNLGWLQAFYGADLSLGSYHVDDYYRLDYTGGFNTPLHTDTIYHLQGGNYSFGAYGFNLGLNTLISMPSGGEIRLGVEGSLHREFGQYLKLRNSITGSDSTFEVLATGRWTETLGGYLDCLHKGRRTAFGYKISSGGSFVSPDNYKGYHRLNAPFYFSNTLHLTKRRVTGFATLNFGPYTATFQTGVNYQLSAAARKRH